MQCGAGRFGTIKPGQDPGGEVLRGKAAAGRGDVADGVEGLWQYLHACFGQPRGGCRVGAGGEAGQEAEAGQQQGPGTLGADQLAAWIEPQLRHHRGICGDVPGADATSDEYRVGLAGIGQAALSVQRDAIH